MPWVGQQFRAPSHGEDYIVMEKRRPSLSDTDTPLLTHRDSDCRLLNHRPHPPHSRPPSPRPPTAVLPTSILRRPSSRVVYGWWQAPGSERSMGGPRVVHGPPRRAQPHPRPQA